MGSHITLLLFFLYQLIKTRESCVLYVSWYIGSFLSNLGLNVTLVRLIFVGGDQLN